MCVYICMCFLCVRLCALSLSLYIYTHAYIHDSNQTNLNSGRAQKSELNRSDVKKSPPPLGFSGYGSRFTGIQALGLGTIYRPPTPNPDRGFGI